MESKVTDEICARVADGFPSVVMSACTVINFKLYLTGKHVDICVT